MALIIKPLDFEFGLFAKAANATARNAIDMCESGLSVLMIGRRKSKDPLDDESRGIRTKFEMKKHGACSSIGTVKVTAWNGCGFPSESEVGVIRDDDSSMSSFFVSRPLVKIIWRPPFLGEIGEMIFLVRVPRLALTSVAWVSFRNMISKSSLYPGH